MSDEMIAQADVLRVVVEFSGSQQCYSTCVIEVDFDWGREKDVELVEERLKPKPFLYHVGCCHVFCFC